jgi:hypothetical protein
MLVAEFERTGRAECPDPTVHYNHGGRFNIHSLDFVEKTTGIIGTSQSGGWILSSLSSAVWAFSFNANLGRPSVGSPQQRRFIELVGVRPQESAMTVVGIYPKNGCTLILAELLCQGSNDMFSTPMVWFLVL